jgi:hypothetical protein
MVARQRGAHEHDRLFLELGDSIAVVSVTFETYQLAKRLFDDDLLDYRNSAAVFLDFADVEFGLFVILAQSVKQLVAGGNARSAGHVR